MVEIVSSQILWDMPQVDGRRSVREEHTSVEGEVYTIDYMAEENEDINQTLANRVSWFHSLPEPDAEEGGE